MELILNNLRKTYGTVQALKGISYTFKPGIYGILGANGAGLAKPFIMDNDKWVDMD